MKTLSALKIDRRNKAGKRHLKLWMAHYKETAYFQVKAVGIREPVTHKHNIPDCMGALSMVVINICTSVPDKIPILYFFWL